MVDQPCQTWFTNHMSTNNTAAHLINAEQLPTLTRTEWAATLIDCPECFGPTPTDDPADCPCCGGDKWIAR